MFVDDVPLLACPETRNPLRFQGTNLEGRIQDGVLVCADTGTAWRVEEGWARLVRELRLDAQRERLLRLHDRLPRIHDPVLKLLLELAGAPVEGRFRAAALEGLDLGGLPSGQGEPVRVLEVGTGTGLVIEALSARLPVDSAVELWGVDISIGMLHEARRRFDRRKDGPLKQARLLMADAGGLPFQDGIFDRVLHVGGLAGFAEPAAALREMARVARPGAPVVVVERSPDPGNPTGILGGLLSRLLPPTLDADLAELVPTGAQDVQVARLDPIFSVMGFRAP